MTRLMSVANKARNEPKNVVMTATIESVWRNPVPKASPTDGKTTPKAIHRMA